MQCFGSTSCAILNLIILGDWSKKHLIPQSNQACRDFVSLNLCKLCDCKLTYVTSYQNLNPERILIELSTNKHSWFLSPLYHHHHHAQVQKFVDFVTHFQEVSLKHRSCRYAVRSSEIIILTETTKEFRIRLSCTI